MLNKINIKKEFYDVEDVNRTAIHIVFTADYNRNDIIKNILIRRMLLNYSNEFKTIKEFKNAKDKLFIMQYDINIISFVNKILIDVFLSIPKEGLIEEFNLDKVIKFLYDSLFDQYIENDMFNQHNFDVELGYLKGLEKDFPHSINEFAKDVFLQFFDENNLTWLTQEEYMKYLESVDNKQVYDYYKKYIKNNNYDIFIFGNPSGKDNLIKLINKYFKQKNMDYALDFNKYDFLPMLDYKEKQIDTKYSQTILNLFYQFRDLTVGDMELYNMLYYFLNSSENALIYDNLRNKNNLIYNSLVVSGLRYGFIIIRVFLDKNDISKCMDIINQTFADLKVEDNFKIYKDRLMKALQYDIYIKNDNPFHEVKDVFDKIYDIDNSLEEKLDRIMKIEFNEFKSFLDKIVLTRKMIMLAGDNDEC